MLAAIHSRRLAGGCDPQSIGRLDCIHVATPSGRRVGSRQFIRVFFIALLRTTLHWDPGEAETSVSVAG